MPGDNTKTISSDELSMLRSGVILAQSNTWRLIQFKGEYYVRQLKVLKDPGGREDTTNLPSFNEESFQTRIKENTGDAYSLVVYGRQNNFSLCIFAIRDHEGGHGWCSISKLKEMFPDRPLVIAEFKQAAEEAEAARKKQALLVADEDDYEEDDDEPDDDEPDDDELVTSVEVETKTPSTGKSTTHQVTQLTYIYSRCIRNKWQTLVMKNGVYDIVQDDPPENVRDSREGKWWAPPEDADFVTWKSVGPEVDEKLTDADVTLLGCAGFEYAADTPWKAAILKITNKKRAKELLDFRTQRKRKNTRPLILSWTCFKKYFGIDLQNTALKMLQFTTLGKKFEEDNMNRVKNGELPREIRHQTLEPREDRPKRGAISKPKDSNWLHDDQLKDLVDRLHHRLSLVNN